MGWNSCEIITAPARSASAGIITLCIARASSSSSSLSFSIVCGSNGGAVGFIRLSEGGALHRRGKFGGRQESNRAAAIQGENAGRCFLTQLSAPASCGVQRAGPQFHYAFSCRRSGRCRISLCRVSLLFVEQSSHL